MFLIPMLEESRNFSKLCFTTSGIQCGDLVTFWNELGIRENHYVYDTHPEWE